MRWSAVLCGFLNRVLCHALAPPSPTYSAGRRVHLPPVPHAILRPDASKPRTIVIGDVHGCLDELKALLSECKYDAKTTRVVLVGDLVNKGPKSAECVRYVRNSGFACVRGNHDDVALFAWERRTAERMDGGSALSSQQDDKYAYVDAFDAADVAFLRELPHTLRLPEFGALVVHAGLVPGVALDAQEPAAMITIRNLLPQEGADCVPPQTEENEEAPKPAAPGRRWSEKAKAGVAWAPEWRPDAEALEGVSHIIFGHDARRGLQLAPYATGLDTGACYGNRLSAIILDRARAAPAADGELLDRRIVSVPSHRVYSKPAG